ncbi:unnamed protein product [Menidia menidia]|uniref:(Atlantic silverside) hypothetical protein n=1 Tax=Menidia menidia TaxID=238744 RepID=A0A8S4BH45_9TELE|nr:unnamed protein product [Menidia menidia]
MSSSRNQTAAVSSNSTSDVFYEWEYYYDYIEPMVVDETKLKYNKYSIVIILWISLAAFVGLLFLSLNLLSFRGTFSCRRQKPKIKRNPSASSA